MPSSATKSADDSSVSLNPSASGANSEASARRYRARELGDVLEACRNYLLMIASRSLDPQLRTKISSADLVQQTFMQAHREIDQFRGGSDVQLRAWLRRILLNNVASSRRRFLTDKRNMLREHVATEFVGLPSRDKTPSSIVSKNEEVILLEIAMRRLPACERRVIQMRNLDRKTFHEIANEFECGNEGARRLWFRALQSLKEAFQALKQG